MLIATLAIAGVPPLAGFFSKDAILLAAFQSENGGHPLYAIGLFTALLTSFYMFRLIFLTFFGKQRYDEHHVHVHESPWSMLGPLVILAVLSIFGGWFAAPAFWGGTDYFASFLAPVFGTPESVRRRRSGRAPCSKCFWRSLPSLTASSASASPTGSTSASPTSPEQLAKSMKASTPLCLNKYYVDELYAAVVVKPLLWISTNVLWKTVDVAGHRRHRQRHRHRRHRHSATTFATRSPATPAATPCGSSSARSSSSRLSFSGRSCRAVTGMVR